MKKMKQLMQILIIIILTISNYNHSFANDTFAFVNHFSKLLLNQKNNKLEKLIFTVNDYERYSKNIGQDADARELKNWERDIHEIINSSNECISEIKKQSAYLGELKLYDFHFTPNFEAITNRGGDTLSIVKRYKLTIIFEKGVNFFSIETEVINAFNSFWLLDELEWGDKITPSTRKKNDNKKDNFYVIFSYNYGQILLDSRVNKVYLNNDKNPNFYTSNIKLTKEEINRIKKKLEETEFIELPVKVISNQEIYKNNSCDNYRICVNGIEYHKLYCYSDNLDLQKKYGEVGNLLKEIIERKKAYKRKKNKARMFYMI